MRAPSKEARGRGCLKSHTTSASAIRTALRFGAPKARRSKTQARGRRYRRKNTQQVETPCELTPPSAKGFSIALREGAAAVWSIKTEAEKSKANPASAAMPGRERPAAAPCSRAGGALGGQLALPQKGPERLGLGLSMPEREHGPLFLHCFPSVFPQSLARCLPFPLELDSAPAGAPWGRGDMAELLTRDTRTLCLVVLLSPVLSLTPTCPHQHFSSRLFC